jgi:hypothetical protein
MDDIFELVYWVLKTFLIYCKIAVLYIVKWQCSCIYRCFMRFQNVSKAGKPVAMHATHELGMQNIPWACKMVISMQNITNAHKILLIHAICCICM